MCACVRACVRACVCVCVCGLFFYHTGGGGRGGGGGGAGGGGAQIDREDERLGARRTRGEREGVERGRERLFCISESIQDIRYRY